MSENTNAEIRVLKSWSCPSLSGKSKLGYEIGCDPESAIHIRVSTNTGTGFFSKDWVPWAQVQQVLDKHARKPITSHTLSPIYKGRSVNTAGFLLAALKHAGLVQVSEQNRRCYEYLDPTEFLSQIQGLLGAPKAATKKATPKTPKG